MQNNKYTKDCTLICRQLKGGKEYNNRIKCDSFSMILFVEGSGIHYIDNVEFQVFKNQIHFVFPGQHHYWEVCSNTLAYEVTLENKLYESCFCIDEIYLIKISFNPVIKLSSTIFEVVNREIENLKRDWGLFINDHFCKKIVQMRIAFIISLIIGEDENKINNKDLFNPNILVKQYWNLILKHFTEEKMITWYADKLCISSNYLNILCKKYINRTAKGLLCFKIIHEAKSHLVSSDLSIKMITYELGFESVSAFSSFFKKYTSLSPTEYRLNSCNNMWEYSQNE